MRRGPAARARIAVSSPPSGGRPGPDPLAGRAWAPPARDPASLGEARGSHARLPWACRPGAGALQCSVWPLCAQAAGSGETRVGGGGGRGSGGVRVCRPACVLLNRLDRLQRQRHRVPGKNPLSWPAGHGTLSCPPLPAPPSPGLGSAGIPRAWVGSGVAGMVEARAGPGADPSSVLDTTRLPACCSQLGPREHVTTKVLSWGFATKGHPDGRGD